MYDGSMMRSLVLGILLNFGALNMVVQVAEASGTGMTTKHAFSDTRVVKLVEAISRGDLAEADRQRTAGADVNATGTDDISP